MRYLVLTTFSSLLLISCGGSSPEAKKENPPAAVTPPAAPVDSATVGSITGKIAFSGAKPTRNVISMDAVPACARQHSGPIYAEDVIVNDNGTLKNAFIYIKTGVAKKDFPPAAPARLDQKGCVYTPRVVGVMVNQPIEISNSDDVNHNVHPLPKANREWNESQPPKGPVKVKTFTKPEVPPILIKCNVHPWMRAWVAVVDNPYFAVSGDDGTFTIKDVPPGDYTIEAWHERFGVQTLTVKVEARQAQTADFTFKSN